MHQLDKAAALSYLPMFVQSIDMDRSEEAAVKGNNLLVLANVLLSWRTFVNWRGHIRRVSCKGQQPACFGARVPVSTQWINMDALDEAAAKGDNQASGKDAAAAVVLESVRQPYHEGADKNIAS
eukprot:280067-Pelagomonas_calceolata.AAC.3